MMLMITRYLCGISAIEDVAPEPLRLGQVEVDGEIAKMLTANEHEGLKSVDKATGRKQVNTLPGIPTTDLPPSAMPAENADKDTATETELTELSSIPDKSSGSKTAEKSTNNARGETEEAEEHPANVHKGAHPKTSNKESKQCGDEERISWGF